MFQLWHGYVFLQGRAMTDTALIALAKEALELAAAATAGPWSIESTERVGDYGVRPKDRRKNFLIMVNEACGRMSTDPHLAADREFIAMSRTALPLLAHAVLDLIPAALVSEARASRAEFWAKENDALAEELARYKAAWTQAQHMFRTHAELCRAKGEQFRPCGRCSVEAMAAKHGFEISCAHPNEQITYVEYGDDSIPYSGYCPDCKMDWVADGEGWQ